MAIASPRPRNPLFRLLEREERVFALLLAVVLVGTLFMAGLIVRPRYGLELTPLVMWFAAYKAGVLVLITVLPGAARPAFLGALVVDLLIVFWLMYRTGGLDSIFYLLFFPLAAINAYYFGRWAGVGIALVAGLLYAWAAYLVEWYGWKGPIVVMGVVGLPAYAVGQAADRERRARSEAERLNAELTGTLTRLQTAQEKLVEAERMATVGRLSLKIAHEVRNPIAAIELNAELLGDIIDEQAAGADPKEASSLVRAIREQVTALDALTEEYLAFARFPKPQFEEDSVNDMVRALAEFVRPWAEQQGIELRLMIDDSVPPMEMDRTLLRQAVLNLVKNGFEVMSQGGTLTIDTRRADDSVTITIADTGPGITPEVGRRLFEQFFTTKPQGTGLGLSISRQIVEEHGGRLSWSSRPGAGATFTVMLPLKR